MKLAIALKTLSRHKITLVLGAVVSILLGLTLAYKLPSMQPRTFTVGVATNEVLIDAPQSQIAAVNPAGALNLGSTATILGTLITEGDVKQRIAERAGITPSKLVGVAQQPPGSTGAQQIPAASYARSFNAGILETSIPQDVNGNALPIVNVQATAHDAATATKIVDATVPALLDYLSSTASADKVPLRNRLKISSLGVTQAKPQSAGTGPAMAVVVAVVLFGGVCFAILLASGIARGWKQAAELESEELEDDAETASDDEDDDYAAVLPLLVEPTFLDELRNAREQR
jgi:hypothetical protein